MARWQDWLDQNPSRRLALYTPANVADVVTAVRTEKKLRAVGARHADNRVGRPDDGTAYVDPRKLTGITIVKRTPGGAIVYLRAGTRIRDVNEGLWKLGLALPNLGSFDEQYVAGAVGTGTHGSGATLGPLADALAGVDLVDGLGNCWRVEDPASPTTAPSAFARSNPGWKLVQDDLPLWRSVGVHAGAAAVIVGVMLRVLDAYKLWERRRGATWQAMPKDVAGWRNLAGEARHVELLVCPYPSEDGTNYVVHTKRDVATDALEAEPVPATTDDLDALPPNSRHFVHEAQRYLRKLGVKLPLGWFLLHNPDEARTLLKSGMQTLVPKVDRPYDFVDRSYRILLLGVGARAHGFELAIPLEHLNAVVDVILAAAATWNAPGTDKHARCVFTAPFAVRFVKGGPQFLGTNGVDRLGGATCDTWAYVEIPRLRVAEEDERKPEFTHYPHAAVTSIWNAVRPFGVRAHWGQHELLAPIDLPRLYPHLDAWKQQAVRLDPSRKLANARAVALGLR